MLLGFTGFPVVSLILIKFDCIVPRFTGYSCVFFYIDRRVYGFRSVDTARAIFLLVPPPFFVSSFQFHFAKENRSRFLFFPLKSPSTPPHPPHPPPTPTIFFSILLCFQMLDGLDGFIWYRLFFFLFYFFFLFFLAWWGLVGFCFSGTSVRPTVGADGRTTVIFRSATHLFRPVLAETLRKPSNTQ